MTCTKSVEIHSSGSVFRMTKSSSEPNGVAVSYEGASTPFSHRATAEGATAVDINTANNVEVVFDPRRGSFAVKAPSTVYGGKMTGICGQWRMHPGSRHP